MIVQRMGDALQVGPPPPPGSILSIRLCPQHHLGMTQTQSHPVQNKCVLEGTKDITEAGGSGTGDVAQL